MGGYKGDGSHSITVKKFQTLSLSVPERADSLQKAQGNLPIRSVRVAREGG